MERLILVFCFTMSTFGGAGIAARFSAPSVLAATVPPPTLTGEAFFVGAPNVTTACRGSGSFTFSLAGSAAGPYPGSTVLIFAQQQPAQISEETFASSQAQTTLIVPTNKAQCKDGGYQNYPQFTNQGDCVSFVASGGKNPPGIGP